MDQVKPKRKKYNNKHRQENRDRNSTSVQIQPKSEITQQPPVAQQVKNYKSIIESILSDRVIYADKFGDESGDNHRKTFSWFSSPKKDSRIFVRNQVPQTNNRLNFMTWKYAYYPYILELKNIFVKGMLDYGIHIKNSDSYEFIHEFSYYIRNVSSGYISQHLD
jgi:hypothetical protein